MAAPSILKSPTQVATSRVHSASKIINLILELWMSSHPSGAARLSSNPLVTLGQHLTSNPLRKFQVNCYSYLLTIFFFINIRKFILVPRCWIGGLRTTPSLSFWKFSVSVQYYVSITARIIKWFGTGIEKALSIQAHPDILLARKLHASAPQLYPVTIYF